MERFRLMTTGWRGPPLLWRGLVRTLPSLTGGLVFSQRDDKLNPFTPIAIVVTPGGVIPLGGSQCYHRNKSCDHLLLDVLIAPASRSRVFVLAASAREVGRIFIRVQ